MIENILIVDTETTGLSPDKGSKLIEVAAVLFNLEHKAILQTFSTLLPCNENPVEHINNISVGSTQAKYAFRNKTQEEILSESWKNPGEATTILYDEPITFGDIFIAMNDKADACIAHNAEFDKKFLATQPWGHHLLSNKWICTKANFTWPVPLTRFRQQDICQAMGVEYTNAHRALSDCLLLAQCFQKVDDLQMRIGRC